MFIVSLTYIASLEEADLFNKANLATYQIQEFMPTMTSKEFENLKE